MENIRINKFLSEKGICSRREADRLITEGRVLINGNICEPGQKVGSGDIVTVDNKKVDIELEVKPELVAFYKPRGIVCTTSDRDRAQNVIDYLDYDARLFPIGRLDKESEGLLLLTNRGELVNLINKSVNGHEKEYIVRCERRLTDGFLRKLSQGVDIKIPIENKTGASSENNKRNTGRQAEAIIRRYKHVITKPCKVLKIDDYTFNIILTQGLNRQIRRMCAALGNNVLKLKRVRIMNIVLGDLKEGEFRQVEGRELKELEKTLGLIK